MTNSTSQGPSDQGPADPGPADRDLADRGEDPGPLANVDAEDDFPNDELDDDDVIDISDPHGPELTMPS